IMNLWENVLVALQGLAANKLRSLLTMLGIIIGVLAVILGTAIGQGSRQQVLERIQSLGSNAITVFPGQSRQGAVMGGAGSRQSLKMEDADAIRKGCPTIIAVAPQVQQRAQVKYGNQNTSTSIICTTPEFLPIRGFRVERGKFFTDSDVRGRRKVCVIGKTTAQNLFGDNVPIGKALRIGGINFKIVGLLALKGSALFGDPDDQIVIPVTTGMKQVFGQDHLSNIYAQTAKAEDAVKASIEIENVLMKAHKIAPNDDPDFTVRTQQEFMQVGDQASQTLTFLLTGIAAVALLVGGIGIMNIMLVSVTERTREIGIRKAVGAKNSNILFQFLIEAMTLSIVGGLTGIGGGFLAANLITSWLGWPTVVSLFWVGVAFSSSAIIGMFFGIYPAWKAAQLDPIEALRYQ
ncbi:MAG TPA: ABC transporter permease, partial [Abditibacteriaceae bacterium]|nr:ABC transporter permease [Abditibacteriaceae bacterium]